MKIRIIANVVTMAAMLAVSQVMAGEPNVSFDQGGCNPSSIIEYAKQNVAAPKSAASALVDTEQSSAGAASEKQQAKMTGSFIFVDGKMVGAHMDNASLETAPESRSAVSEGSLGYDLSSLAV